MKIVVRLASLSVSPASSVLVSSVLVSSLLVSSVFAQSPAPVNVPPPPGIHDPGVQAVTPAATPAAKPAAPPATGSSELPPLVLPSMHDGGLGRDANNQPPPDVSVRQQGDNSIQEYRRNGQVYMIVMTPRNGVPQTYMVDPQGRVVDEHGQKPVKPVMYKVLEWGKSPPAADATESAPGNNSH